MRSTKEEFSPRLTQASSSPASSVPGRETLSLAALSFVPAGQACSESISSIQSWPVELSSSSPLKECLYPEEVRQWVHRPISSWLSFDRCRTIEPEDTLSLIFLTCWRRISSDLKELWEMKDHMSIALNI